MQNGWRSFILKQEEIKITVFTPAFNRAHTLGRCYESMRKQKCKAFKWLIIDDGSTDDTKQLVESWKNRENGFEIIYYYKENGGMHTAHNMAYELIDTELNVCIDSDDCLSENAIEIMLNFWNEYGSSKYAGFVGLDADLEGYIIGKIQGEVWVIREYYIVVNLLKIIIYVLMKRLLDLVRDLEMVEKETLFI